MCLITHILLCQIFKESSTVCCVLLHDLQWENKMSKVSDIIIIVCNLNMMHLPERNFWLYFYCVLGSPALAMQQINPLADQAVVAMKSLLLIEKKSQMPGKRRRKEMMQNQVTCNFYFMNFTFILVKGTVSSCTRNYIV